MAVDEQHVALPKLYGAPAYSRPSRPVEVTERPLDPDDLPIAAFQTDEEREIAETLGGRPYAPGGGAYVESNGQGQPPAGTSLQPPRDRRPTARRLAGLHV